MRSETDERGPLIPIGGAEDKVSDRLILRRFLEISGGPEARIAIIPTASSLPDAGLRYVDIFSNLGAKQARVANIRTREDGNTECSAAIIEGATGIFVTGGNQIRVASVLGGTRVGSGLLDAHERGVPIAGTSAGASVMTSVMVAGGGRRRTPTANMVRMAPGLGLIDYAVIDQHFRERDRIARLVTIVSYNPGLYGLGIDEDTAAIIWPDETMEVVGSGTVVIVDGAHMTSNVHTRRDETPLNIVNATIHFLTSGSRFDFDERKAYPSLR